MSGAIAKRCMEVLPPGLVQALGPVLEQIASLTVKIKQYDRLYVNDRSRRPRAPEIQALIKVYGVWTGQLPPHSPCMFLTLGSKQRFQRSRGVGCYPSAYGQGEASPATFDPQLGITKAGNIYLRSLLVRVRQPRCASWAARKDSTLRQWGLHLASAAANGRVTEPSLPSHASFASCSIAIWVTQQPYLPFYALAA